jgi:hypothetical protein
MNNISNKNIRNVADIAARIMMGEKVVHPNQQKLDVHEPEKDELTAKDFEMLRAGKKADVKKEEVDLDEGKMGQLDADLKDLSHGDFQKEYGKPKSHYDPSKFKKPVQKGQEMNRARALAQRAMASMKKEEVEEIEEGEEKIKYVSAQGRGPGRVQVTTNKGRKMMIKHPVAKDSNSYSGPQVGHKMSDWEHMKEEVEQIDEYKSVDGVYKHQGTYGKEKSVEAGYTDYDKENEMAKKLVKPKKPVTKGARQNRNFNTKLYKEGFTELVSTYSENGLKGLFESLKKEEVIVEEPTSAEFDAEIKKAQAKSEGKEKADVAKGAVQAVQNEQTHTTVEVLDFDSVNGIQRSEIDLEERKMSEPEMKKKEEIVKGMKKGLSGFKERYGDRAKEVMHATATKQAMKD